MLKEVAELRVILQCRCLRHWLVFAHVISDSLALSQRCLIATFAVNAMIVRSFAVVVRVVYLVCSRVFVVEKMVGSMYVERKKGGCREGYKYAPMNKAKYITWVLSTHLDNSLSKGTE